MESAEQKNKYISLAEASGQTPYSQEYLSLRARQGKLQAKKVGRDWVTTSEWVSDYLIQAKAGNPAAAKARDEYISLQEAAKHTRSKYSQEYLSLRVRQGKLRAKKVGRNWMTTQAWVDEYEQKVKEAKVQKQAVEGPVAEKIRTDRTDRENFLTSDVRDSEVLNILDIGCREELNPSQPSFTKEGVIGIFLEPFVWLGKSFEKGASRLREAGVLLSLRWQVLEEAIKAGRVAPGLVSRELRYFRIAALSLLLAVGGGVLVQENIRTGLAKDLAGAMAKIGEATIEAPNKISQVWQKVEKLPTALKKRTGELRISLDEDIKGSIRVARKGSNEIVVSLAGASNELAWQSREAGRVGLSVYRFISSTENQDLLVGGILNAPSVVVQFAQEANQKIFTLAASVSQNAEDKVFSAAYVMAGWPNMIKDAYINLDQKNEQAKSRISEALTRGSLAMGEFYDNIPDLPSLVYDKYLVVSQNAGRVVNDTAIAVWNQAKAIALLPQRAGNLTIDAIDAVGGAINNGLSFVGGKIAFLGRSVLSQLSFGFYHLTQYGQLSQNIDSLFGKNIAVATPFLTLGNQQYFSEMDSLQNEVNKLKVAMSELQFSLSLKDEEAVQQSSQLPPTIVAGPGGQLIQVIQRIEKITQILPPGDYAKTGDLAATEQRLLAAIDNAQRTIISQGNNYTTNNFYSWAPTQRIDNLGNVTISSIILSGGLAQTGNGGISFSGKVSANNGLDVAGANFTVGGTNFVVDNSGNLDMTGNLTIGGNHIITGNFTVNGSSVLGSNISTSTLAVSGPMTLTVSSSTTALAITQYGSGAGLMINASSSTSTLAVYQNGSGTALDILQNSVAGNLINLRNATGTLFLIDGFGQVTLGTTTVNTSLRGQNIIAQLGDNNSLYNFSLKSFSGTNLLTVNSGGNLTLNANATSSIKGDVYFDTNTLVIDSINNRVGIGTTSPLATFSIQGTVPGQTNLFTIASSTGDNLLTFTANGDLGIATTSPLGKFDVSNQFIVDSTSSRSYFGTDGGALYGIGRLNIVGDFPHLYLSPGTGDSAGAKASGIKIDNNGDQYAMMGVETAAGGFLVPGTLGYSMVVGTDGARALHLTTNNAVRMTFDTTGNVGIGTTSPATTLHVVDATEQLRLGFDGQNYTSFTTGADGAIVIMPTNNATTTIANSLALTQPQAYFLNNGKIGFGTLSPSVALEIATTTTQLRLAYDASNYTDFTVANDGALTIDTTNAGTTTITHALQAALSFYVLNNGLVGIQTTAPAYNLDVNGTLRSTGISYFNADTYFGNVTTTDVVHFNSRIADHLVPTIDNVSDLGDGTYWLRWRTGYFGTSVGIGGTATSTGTTLTYNGVGNITVGQASTWQTLVGDLTLQSAAQLIASSTTNTIFATGGVERAKLTTSGNFGIASSSPSFVLSLIGNSYFTGNHYQQGNATTTGFLNIGQLLSVSGTGTSTFASNLSVGGSFDTTGTSYFRAPTLLFDGSAVSPALSFINDQNLGLFRSAADELAITTNGTQRAVFDAAGQLGIGTTSPVATLHVVDTTEQLRLGFNGQNYTAFTVGADGAIVIVPTNSATTTIANALALSQPQAYFLNNGKIGFGTLAPSAALEIATTTNPQLRLAYNSTNYTDFTVANDGALTIDTTNVGTTTITHALQAASSFYVLNNGLVGIQTTSPQYNLDVNGTLRTTGSVVLGDAVASDLLTLNSRVNTSIIPSADNTYDLGDGTNWLRWRTGYFGTSVGIGGTATSTGTTLTYNGVGNITVGQASTWQTLVGDLTLQSAAQLIASSTTNTIFATGGVERAKLTTSGNFGIASSSPSFVLSLIGNSYFTGNHYQQGNATTTGFLNIGQLLSVSGTGTSTFASNLSVGGSFDTTGTSYFRAPTLLFDGSAVSPALSFINDQNLGLFRSAADELAITTNGTQRAVFDAAGQLGIGTTSPVATLHVVDTTEQLRLGFNGQNYTAFTVGADGAIVIVPTNSATTTIANALALSQPQAYFLNNGKIGFGTLAPSAALEIATTTNPQLRLAYNSTNYANFNILADGAMTLTTTNAGTTTITNAFQAASTFYALQNGNVGISTSTPVSKFSVVGDSYFTGDHYQQGNATTTGFFYLGQLFNIAGTGTSTIADNLSINGQLKIGSSLYLNTDSIWSTGVFNLIAANNNNLNITTSGTGDLAVNVEQLFVDSSLGYVGISTSTPVTHLAVDGNGYIIGGLGVGVLNTGAGTLQTSGNATIGHDLNVTGEILVSGIATSTFTGPVLITATENPGLKIGNNSIGYMKIGGSTIYDNLVDLTLDSDTTQVNIPDNLYLVGDLLLQGSATLGSDSADQIVFNGLVNSNIIPKTDASFTLGTGVLRWKEIWTSTLYASSTSVDSTNLDSFTINADNVSADMEDSSLQFERGTVSNAIIRWDSTNDRFNFNMPIYAEQYIQVAGSTATSTFTGAVVIESTTNPGLQLGNGISGIMKIGGSLFYDSSGDLTLDSDTGTVILGPGDNLTVPGILTVQSAIATSTFAGGLAIDTNGLVFDWQTNNVGINTASPAYKLDVNGTLRTTGSVVLGDNVSSDLLTLNSRVNISIIPSADNQYDLGDGTNWLRWRTGYFGTSVGIGGTATTTATLLAFNGVGNITMGSGSVINVVSGNLSINTTNNQPVLFGSGNVNIPYASSTALTVSGLASTTNIYVSGSAYLSPMTQGSIFFSGASGLISQDNANLFWDDANNRLGISTTSPATNLAVAGNLYLTGDLQNLANLTATGTITHNAFAYTGLTASTEKTDVNFNLARTVQFSAGNLATQRALLIQAPTYSFTASSTLTDASTLSITGAPKSGAFATTTNVYALNIAAGSVAGAGIMPTNAYGLYVNAPAGATNNYGAVFATGNVGIGTSTPNWQLQVAGTRPSLALSDTSAAANSKHWLMSSMGGNLYIGTSTDAYATSTPAALTILNNGNVGIGTAGPAYKLDVNGTLRAVDNVFFNSNITLGDATTTDVVYINSRIGGHLIPTGDNVSDIGDATNWLRWRTGYFGTSVGVAGTATTTATALTFSGVGNLSMGSASIINTTSGTLSINTTNNQPVVFGSGQITIPYASSTAITVSGTASTTNLYVSGSAYLSPMTAGSVFFSGASGLISQDNANLFWDDANNRLGISTTSPATNLAVAGNLYLTGDLQNLANLTATGTITHNAFAYTGLTASTEKTDVNFNLARTVQFSAGNLATQRALLIQAPTYSFTASSTLTDASTLSITGAPKSGAFATTTNVYALNIAAGSVAGAGIMPTNAYGLYVNAPAGATNNYGAVFATGNVGIGTSTPNWQLQVAGTRPSLALSDTSAAANSKHWLMSSMGGNLYIGTSTDAYATSTPSALTILNNGNLGIGTSSPSKKLAVSGALYVTSASHFGSDLQVDGALNVDGNLSVNSTVLSIDSATGNLTTNGTGWFKTDLKVDGNATTTGILNVGGALKVGGDLTLTGNTTISGTATSTGNLGTSGNFYALGNIQTSGVFYASNGTALLPSYTFSSDPNTGIFSAAADKLAFTTNGSERMRIDDAGNFGIGTTSPYSLLSISNSVSTTANTPLFTIASTTAGTATSTLFTVLASGNVGIGTTSPYAKLSVAGNAVIEGILTVSTLTATTSISAPYFTATSAIATSTFAGGLAVDTTGLVYDYSSDNVGIGTAGPSYKLHVSGDIYASGDLRVAGDDLFMNTNTSGAVLVADGTNFNPVVMSGDVVIGTTGTATIQDNSVDGTDIAMGSDATGDLLYYNGTDYARMPDVAVGSYLRSGGVTTAPLWSTLVLPNAATAYRLPVATSANTIGELAASGAAGEYLAGATSAIPAWATLNQAAVAGLTTGSSPTFAGLTLTAALTVANGGTGVSTLALNGILYGNAASAVGVTAIGAAGQILRVGASPFVPAWTTATFADTYAASTLLYSNGANTVQGLATANSAVLVTGVGGVPALSTDIPTAVTIGAKYIYRADGTDVPLADGGTNASLTANVGGIFYSSATAGAILAGTATAGQMLRSGASAAPTWSTATFPATAATAGAYLRADGTNWITSTLVLPNAATAYRLPVATSANTIGELAASGAAGEYLAGATGAIPAWATLNQAAVAGLTTGSSPTFAGLTLTAALTVANGGTGASTLTGILQGNGISAITGITGTTGWFPYFNSANTILATSTIFVSTAGNVGIGTTTPMSLLSLKSTTGPQLTVAYSDTKYSTFSTDSAGLLTIAGNQGTGGNVTVDVASFLGVGLDSPSYKLDVYQDLSSGYAARIYNDGNNADRYGLIMQVGADDNAGTNYMIDFRDGDGTSVGSITAAGGTVSYGAFTANHVVQVPADHSETGYEYGTLMCVKSVYAESGMSRNLKYQVEPCSQSYAANLLGAYAGRMSNSSIEHQVYVLGDGHILVNNEGGDIQVGDPITTSSQTGYGMKAVRDGKIVGYAQENYTFSGPSDIKLIPVQYSVGNYSRSVGFVADNLGRVGLGTTTPNYKLQVIGDVAALGFVNVSTREAKKDIEYLTADDYESVLAKISDVKVATYWYNDEDSMSGSLTADGSQTAQKLNPKRLGLIAEEAPLEVLSADGKGVDLYKLASFTLAGVKELVGQFDSLSVKTDSLESRVAVLEELGRQTSEGRLTSTDLFNQALETLGGEPIVLAPSSIAELVNNLYASVINGLRQMGFIVEQGIVRAQKLIADVLQINKLVINAAPQTDASGQTKDATIGSAQVNVGELDTYIINNQVSTTTKIFVTPETPIALGVCETHAQETLVENVMRPQGFRVCLNATSSQIVKFNWWIIETVNSASSDNPNIESPEPGLSDDGALNSPSPSASPVVSVAPTPTPSETPVVSATPTPTPTETPVASETPVPSETPEPSVEPSPTPSETPSPSSEPSVSPEPSATPSETPVATPTPSATPSETPAG